MRAALLDVRGVAHAFPASRGVEPVRALDGVDLTVAGGEIVALVGESASGKLTLARVVVGLLTPQSGHVTIDGLDVSQATGGDRARVHRAAQIVFQDPYISLNPRLSVGTSVGEPLLIHPPAGLSRRGRASERRRRVIELLGSVGLPAAAASRRPAELSGGERQRVAIARALALGPKLLVLDEPISALDHSVAAQVMDLLAQLQRRDGLAYLLISHDLATVRSIAHRVAVMDTGRIVEEGPAERVLSAPVSDRGRALLEAAQALSPPPWPWPGSTTQA